MLKVDAGLVERGLDARIVLTVHDELVLETPSVSAEVTMEAVRSLMEQAHPMRVQLVVDARCARTWAEAKT
jgi:DNA polymerase-1